MNTAELEREIQATRTGRQVLVKSLTQCDLAAKIVSREHLALL